MTTTQKTVRQHNENIGKDNDARDKKKRKERRIKTKQINRQRNGNDNDDNDEDDDDEDDDDDIEGDASASALISDDSLNLSKLHFSRLGGLFGSEGDSTSKKSREK